MQQQGKTGTELSIKLASSILDAGWLEASVAANGSATAQVLTQFVADGSKIQLTLMDGQGKTQGTISGTVVSNTHRSIVPIPKGAQDVLLFKAELSALGLNATSRRLELRPVAAIEKPQWIDASGKALAELEDPGRVKIEAKVSGVPPKTPCQCRILSSSRPGSMVVIHKADGEVKGGKVSFPWDFEFPHDHKSWPSAKDGEKYEEKYEHATYQAELTCLGTRVLSDPLPYKSWIEFQVEGFKGTIKFQLPEGRVEEVKTDGAKPIRIKNPGVGEVVVIERVPDKG